MKNARTLPQISETNLTQISQNSQKYNTRRSIGAKIKSVLSVLSVRDKINLCIKKKYHTILSLYNYLIFLIKKQNGTVKLWWRY